MDAMIGSLLVVLFFIALYFIPTLIAVFNNRSNQTAIMALNFLLGWTFIGWVVALIWSLTDPKPQYIIMQPPASAPTSPASPASTTQV